MPIDLSGQEQHGNGLRVPTHAVAAHQAAKAAAKLLDEVSDYQRHSETNGNASGIAALVQEGAGKIQGIINGIDDEELSAKVRELADWPVNHPEGDHTGLVQCIDTLICEAGRYATALETAQVKERKKALADELDDPRKGLARLYAVVRGETAPRPPPCS